MNTSHTSKRPPSAQQVGRAGELFVAAELNRRGVAATLYLTNAPRVDVVATSPDGQRTVNIQVKTKGPRSRVWQWSTTRAKAECEAPDTDYMILVDLAEEHPAYYIHRLRDVAQDCHTRHEAWIARVGKRPHNPDSTHTAIEVDQVVSGKGAWDVLGVLPQK